MPAEGLSSLGSLSGGVCGAAAALALARRRRLGGSADNAVGRGGGVCGVRGGAACAAPRLETGDVRLGLAVRDWLGEQGIDVQGADDLPLLSPSAAAGGTVALAAAALAAVTAALAPFILALAAGLSLPLRLASVFAMASPPPLPLLLASAGLAAAALALSAAQRLGGAVRPRLPERLLLRLLFLLGPRHSIHDVSMLMSSRREPRIRGR